MKGQGPFTPMFPTVETVFNPARYYAETGQEASDVPNAPRAMSLGRSVLPFVVLVVAVWAIERHRLGIGFKFGASA